MLEEKTEIEAIKTQTVTVHKIQAVYNCQKLIAHADSRSLSYSVSCLLDTTLQYLEGHTLFTFKLY